MVNAGAGDDTIVGSAGRDYLNGGAGDDLLVGGLGNDVIAGGTGNNNLFGGDYIGASSATTDAQFLAAISGGSDAFIISPNSTNYIYGFDAPGGWAPGPKDFIPFTGFSAGSHLSLVGDFGFAFIGPESGVLTIDRVYNVVDAAGTTIEASLSLQLVGQDPAAFKHLAAGDYVFD